MNCKLKRGDTIGVIAPSAPISTFCPHRLKRGVVMLEKMGYKIKLGKTVNLINDYTAGSIKARVDDIHEMFLDNEVKAIIATIGGYNSNDLLDKLDYKLIKDNNGKLFIGYSDITILLFSLWNKSEVRTIMGPMILPQFGEFPSIQEFTRKSFEHVVSNIGSNREYELSISNEYTEEMLIWDKEDNRARQMKKNIGWKIISEGETEGILLAANINTFSKLVGTEYFSEIKNSIFFLEDDDEVSASKVQSQLQYFKNSKIFNNVKAMVFGRFQKNSKITEKKLNDILLNVFEKINIPIISNVDFGHTDPVLTLPLGAIVKLSTTSNSIKIVL